MFLFHETVFTEKPNTAILVFFGQITAVFHLSLPLLFFLAESFSTFYFRKCQIHVRIFTVVLNYFANHRLVSSSEKLKKNLLFEKKIAWDLTTFSSKNTCVIQEKLPVTHKQNYLHLSQASFDPHVNYM